MPICANTHWTSLDELQKAAQAAALPTQAQGPLPQLVRDLSAALAKQQTDHEALQRRLTQLQPSVLKCAHPHAPHRAFVFSPGSRSPFFPESAHRR